MVDSAASPERLAVRLYTDRYVIRGRVSVAGDLVATLEAAGGRIDLESAVYDESGSREIVGQVPFVLVNLDHVLIVAPDETWSTAAEATTNHSRDEIMVALPPFRVTGRLRAPGGAADELRDVLARLGERFIRLDEATFWSESLNEPRTRAPWLIVNRARAHLIAPFEERDVWAGVTAFEARAPEGST